MRIENIRRTTSILILLWFCLYANLSAQEHTELTYSNTFSDTKTEVGIDETTQKLPLGWNSRISSPIKIIGEDISETGHASAYIPHHFMLEKNNMSISNPKWVLEIPKKDGEIESITLIDKNLSCTTDSITDAERYKINSDGEIEATLSFSCSANGEDMEAEPFKIFFELKPFIEYAKILEIHDNAPYDSYDAYFEVKCLGTDRILVSVEEEYSSKLKSQYIYEPYIASGIAKHINSLFYAWMDFIAINEYGESVYTIELGPNGTVVDPGNSDIKSNVESANVTFEVYDTTGMKIGVFNTVSEIKASPCKGLLIVRRIEDKVAVETFKIICQ